MCSTSNSATMGASSTRARRTLILGCKGRSSGVIGRMASITDSPKQFQKKNVSAALSFASRLKAIVLRPASAQRSAAAQYRAR